MCASIEAIAKSFTRDLFDSYGNNQKLAASNPSPFPPFQTVISHRKKKQQQICKINLTQFAASTLVQRKILRKQQNITKNLTLRPVVNGWKTTANSL